MAKTGKKTIIFYTNSISNLENCIDFAEKRAKNHGLRVNIKYNHDSGLFINIAGPKDKINLFEHQLRDYYGEINK